MWAVVVICVCEFVVVVVCGCSWLRVGVLIIHVGGCRPWVLVVNRGVVVGDGRAVVVVPRRPGVWAFAARKVAVNVART